jgi:hypothetical protein
MWSVAFLCFTPCLCCATLSQACLFEVPVTYLGSLGYFPAWDPMLPNGRPSERLLLMGCLIYVAYLAWSCTISVHTLPHGHCQLSTGGPDGAPL